MVAVPGDVDREKSIPVPERLTFCGLPAALSTMDSVPVRVPLADGLNVTSSEQFAPAARLAPQVFDCEKSPLSAPVIRMLEMLNVAVPLLVRVKLWVELAEFTV